MRQPRLQASARVANQFDLDPVLTYGEEDIAKWLVRVASYGVIAKDEREAHERSKRGR